LVGVKTGASLNCYSPQDAQGTVEIDRVVKQTNKLSPQDAQETVEIDRVVYHWSDASLQRLANNIVPLIPEGDYGRLLDENGLGPEDFNVPEGHYARCCTNYVMLTPKWALSLRNIMIIIILVYYYYYRKNLHSHYYRTNLYGGISRELILCLEEWMYF
jgi:hypothetical protein